MELKRGYKQTEVGVIPEEWEVRSLAEVSSKITDGTHDTPTPVRSGIPFLTAIHIKENFIDYDGCLFLSEEDHRVIFARCNPNRGDVLMVNIGAGVATTSFVDVDFEFSLKNVALVKPAISLVNGRYLNHCLIRRKSAITHALSSGGAQPFLSLTQIGQIRIPAPPLPEQCAIAEALSDVDALIGSLDQLIAKKRDLKQAAMQQLLTGQTRLPGFQGEWKGRPLGSEIADLEAGVSVNSVDDDLDGDCHTFAVLKTSAVENGVFLPTQCKTIAARDIHRVKLNPRAESILISRMNTIDLVGECGYVVADYPRLFVPDRLWMTRFNAESRVSAKWLSFVLSSTDYRRQLRTIATGTSGSMKNISKRAFLSLQVRFPGQKEQTAIAAVLSDMDAELAALQQRRDKTRALKQAMMQELLTGRTRLISPHVGAKTEVKP